MKRKKTKSYAEDFKKTSAQLAFESSKSISDTASDLGLPSSTLHTWVKKYYSAPISEPPKSKNSIELELAQLKKELLVVNQERDILKKASAYFASQIS